MYQYRPFCAILNNESSSAYLSDSLIEVTLCFTFNIPCLSVINTVYFTELSICRDAQHTGWSFYIDTLSIQENNAAYCKCSVNISDEVQDVQVSYNYQGPSSNCTRGFEINLANFSLACNATSMTVAAQDVDAIEFRKETSGQAEPACLLVYIGMYIF